MITTTSSFTTQSQLPIVAVVILNWNGKSFLERFLPSVVANTPANIKIIVADNASSDDSVSFLRESYPSIELTQNGANEGFAKGYNTALKKVQADYYILLNSDVEVTPGWSTGLIQLMEVDKNIAACQPKILSFHQKDLFEYAGASGGWLDILGYPFARGRVFDHLENDAGQYNDSVPCFWASGAAFCVRASVYDTLGGFDEYFFAHQEEIDLCWRIQLSGYKVYVQPASVVYHVGGGTLPKNNSKKTFLNFRNNLIMIGKNLPVLQALWILPLRILLDAVAAWKALLSGKSSDFFAIAKAHAGFIKWVIAKKKNNRPLKNKPGNLLGSYHGSVVWDYFIKKKKTFLEIINNK